MEFSGGGFIFNYRLAIVDYGFVVKVNREPPAGATLETSFENPAGGPPIVDIQTVVPGNKGYMFRTPPVKGVEANKFYMATLKILEAETKKELASYSRSFNSDLDQSVLPEHPLTLGPGYHQPKFG
ncbi:MAG: hypothetical protein OQJ97_12160 [Rhodospirillales bacterium]|nr:hypothetical protein [Rhodospirillales bacterium]